MATTYNRIADVIRKHKETLIRHWAERQNALARSSRTSLSELQDQAQRFLTLLADAAQDQSEVNLNAVAWEPLRDQLRELSISRARQGYSGAETAGFVFGLKEPLFGALRTEAGDDARILAEDILATSQLLDVLGLYTMETYQKSREDIIKRQQQEMLELSTPVVRLWDGILAVPLIGTLDSERTQVVMESLLQAIVDTGSSLAIMDITGVSTVDTLVAQHLLKTVAAARLMGADCIISGIRPQTAQTIVHLGVDLRDVRTKATLADAFALALQLLPRQTNKSSLLG